MALLSISLEISLRHTADNTTNNIGRPTKTSHGSAETCNPVDVHGQWVYHVPHHLQVATHVLVRHDACHTHFSILRIVCLECSKSVVSSKCVLPLIQKIYQLTVLSLLPWMHCFFLLSASQRFNHNLVSLSQPEMAGPFVPKLTLSYCE